ncbi:type II toxin -antitoxin system TacA 1-like antitoxin [Acinetobacter sp. CAAS 2-6]|uniref:type II toxin -antitoxin system TacA 1-like antitoxin n=1 Tax=Acinetobacter sp. CAAS 2-6 TaxID=3016358 RepID=UPI002DD64CF9|nr:DUF1778 domain-containing protein [Acinetobacter sp. CAAS 2-6]
MSAEDHAYVGLCAEFPALSWLDGDQSKAFSRIVELVAEVVAEMISQNETVATPRSAEDMDDFATEQINIQITADTKKVLEQAANLLSISVSDFILYASLERAEDVLKSNPGVQGNAADHAMLIDALENPRPANDAIKHLISLLDKN